MEQIRAPQRPGGLEGRIARLAKQIGRDIMGVGQKIGRPIADLAYLEFVPAGLKQPALRNDSIYTDTLSSFRIVPKIFGAAFAITLGYKGYFLAYFLAGYIYTDLLYHAFSLRREKGRAPATALVDYCYHLYKESRKAGKGKR